MLIVKSFYKFALFFTFVLFLAAPCASFAQDKDEEPITYFQMEPLNDSLFVKIQEEVFIDPPDPKAEIIVDLRDPNNQTVTIKGNLYPFLSFTPETRALITTYPFKINLIDDINLTSVFTKVISSIKLKKIIEPPRRQQISSNLYYINPYLQIFGGERFGFPIKQDVGFSIGLGTPYSGVLETGFVEANFHILGFRLGGFGNVSAFTEIKQTNNHNNLYLGAGYELGYVIPLGNFFEISYLSSLKDPSPAQMTAIESAQNGDYKPMIIKGNYLNWEFRFPFRTMGSTRSKLYLARYLDETHIGFSGRELTIAGSTFDFRFDALTSSPDRNPQYIFDILIQKIADSWASSAVSLGPSVILTKM
ncbi:MAG: hypothetical protein Q8858_14685, partial [Bacteroidota bacterium]|nr:hypothetical protein [Bacteroidota bacterium]